MVVTIPRNFNYEFVRYLSVCRSKNQTPATYFRLKFLVLAYDNFAGAAETKWVIFFLLKRLRQTLFFQILNIPNGYRDNCRLRKYTPHDASSWILLWCHRAWNVLWWKKTDKLLYIDSKVYRKFGESICLAYDIGFSKVGTEAICESLAI